MAASLYLADVATYAALIAAYPENGAAISALPAGTRVYVEDMQMEVARSPSGKWWIPERQPIHPVFTGSNAHWVGPANCTGITSSTGHSRKMFNPVYYRMPGFRPATVSRISLYQTAAGTHSVGSDSCAIRIYAANPDGSPIVGNAALFVWDWNAAGSGGAGVLTLENAGANATRIHSDIPGGAVQVPAHFWLGFVHDLDTLTPNLSAVSSTGVPFDGYPAALNGTDVGNALSPNRSTGYTWTQGTAWAIGYNPVWPAAEYITAGNAAFIPHLKVTA